jgi:hypothetical protein
MERGSLKWLAANPLYAAALALMRISRLPPDLDGDFSGVFYQCKPYTMTQHERMYALYDAVKYLCAARIDGDFVECGAWKGGSAMLMALTLEQCGEDSRAIYIYDTFEGMSRPSDRDIDFLGNRAENTMKLYSREDGKSSWCWGKLDEVRENMRRTRYPEERVSYVMGKVEDTIPGTIPRKIALLHLDTDFYESTYHELVHLYPLLVPGGVLILDDYGHWKGCREAVDQYFKEQRLHVLMNRIDYQGRVIIKP